MKLLKYFGVVTAIFFILGCNQSNEIEFPEEWREYLGGGDKNHYSTVDQINRENLDNLEIAWTYSTPDSGQMQTNALMIDGVVYGISPSVRVFALDAATGKELWISDNSIDAWHSTLRGLAYWESEDKSDKRILYTVGPRLYALNVKDGKLISTFGENGSIDLHTGLPEIAKDKFIISNTPGTIYKNMIIMPVRVSESAGSAPGDIRAFNVITGELVWTFHTIPYPGEFGYETFPEDAYKNASVGSVNNWAGMAIDRKKGIVFVPTGSPSYDFYGGNRKGTNLFSNCLLALDAATGERIWHQQLVHHDIWDRDLPAPPNLVTIKRNGKNVDVVAQITKQGYVYVFDRSTGEPIYPVEEIKVNPSEVEGEEAWPTQPIPTKPAPFARRSDELTADDISPYAENREELLTKFHKYKKGFYEPLSLEGNLLMPGLDGGAEWGGAAVNPDGILFVNSNEMAWELILEKQPDESELIHLPKGERLYTTLCATCHGKDKRGSSDGIYPTLLDISSKYDSVALVQMVKKGKGMMPANPTLNDDDVQSVISYIKGIPESIATGKYEDRDKAFIPFKISGYSRFIDNKGLPGIKPPWGTLSAIDLNTGEYVWKKVLGYEPKLNIKDTGSENYGGPLITASGLLFIAATKDGHLRVFDQKTGELLKELKLPYPSFATPTTYMVNGKQYILLACGGTKLGTPKGNKYVAIGLRGN
jgi:quinoprotein glucose dehydrogenase